MIISIGNGGAPARAGRSMLIAAAALGAIRHRGRLNSADRSKGHPEGWRCGEMKSDESTLRSRPGGGISGGFGHWNQARSAKRDIENRSF
ncbi:hypothetical protein B7486_05535 [cyanobacterium TDX16]|nr:hypothetical protein B7486_05535 [cyanobacterium TDX16]